MRSELFTLIFHPRRNKVLFARELRKRMTEAEAKLWNVLKNRQCCGVKFRRQVPLGPFIVDFCCVEHLLIIEVDGGIHEYQEQYDLERQRCLEEKGFTVLRFANEEVLADFANTLCRIAQQLGSSTNKHKHLPSSQPRRRARG